MRTTKSFRSFLQDVRSVRYRLRFTRLNIPSWAGLKCILVRSAFATGAAFVTKRCLTKPLPTLTRDQFQQLKKQHNQNDMATPLLGEIRLFAGNFAPRGYAFCNGQLLAISQNTALFSLLGTTYGGNGVTTFALPDLRGRVPNHFGQGPGLANYVQGQIGGTENVT